jgi:hypothetical protein
MITKNPIATPIRTMIVNLPGREGVVGPTLKLSWLSLM